MIPLGAEEGIQHPLAFSSSWQILGPFQIGTREATWGSDPLEFIGGFRKLEYEEGAQYRSSIGTNGAVKWSLLEADTIETDTVGSSASLSLNFPHVNWTFFRGVYGWAALQYQAWARGEIFVSADRAQTVIIYTDYVLEFWIDDTHYFGGDFYAFRRSPLVIALKPGAHRIDVRLVRDVRAMGGVSEPSINIKLDAKLASGSLELANDGILMADVVNETLASEWASVTVRNSGSQDIEVVDIECSNEWTSVDFQNTEKFIVSAGQTRPIPFRVLSQRPRYSSLDIIIQHKLNNIAGNPSILAVSELFTKRSIYHPHKITFLHPGGVVSYAILRPPSENASYHSNQKRPFPILLQLHGAGLEADSDLVTHALDSLPDLCAWVLFPTGVTPWSGDDWHNWGFADVEAAVAAVPHWIKAVQWKGADLDTDRWLVSGHSNGGQGTWYTLTHKPDRIIGAAPVSGYTSIQNYVPYELWQPMDPRQFAILGSSMNSYRHELLVENCKGIRILQQHGEDDDNVPAYHSRLMCQLLYQANSSSEYFELSGQGHWFDGVMTTKHLRKFYEEQVKSTTNPVETLEAFSIVVANPGDMGFKGGIRVTQLEIPGQYGRIDVSFNTTSSAYAFKTSNVLSFEVQSSLMRFPYTVIDQTDVEVTSDSSKPPPRHIEFWRASARGWQAGRLAEPGVLHRHGRQLGALDAIMRTKGHFTIRHHNGDTSSIALQISRNLFQYFSADSAIVNLEFDGDDGSGNIFTIAIGKRVCPGLDSNFPIHLEGSSLVIRDSEGHLQRYEGSNGLAAIFLRPLEDEKLELVVWGIDKDSLVLAARLVPMLTGVGQPDFIVLSGSCRWKGAGGAVAMGFFDHSWNVTKTSFFT